jgi:hypothetical protein
MLIHIAVESNDMLMMCRKVYGSAPRGNSFMELSINCRWKLSSVSLNNTWYTLLSNSGSLMWLRNWTPPLHVLENLYDCFGVYMLRKTNLVKTLLLPLSLDGVFCQLVDAIR